MRPINGLRVPFPAHTKTVMEALLYQPWYNTRVWEVRYLEEASRERDGMPAAERLALDHAVDKLAAFGPRLPFPHQSSVR